jgi:DnaJ-domain-containing protein 1
MRDVRPRLSPARFDADITRTRFALVKVDRGPSTTLARGLADAFEAAYPGLFTYGAMPRTAIANLSWWTEHFRTALGPLRTGVGDGTYLFDSRLVVGVHAGRDEELRPMIAYFRDVVDRRLRGDAPPPPRESEPPPRSPPPAPEPVGEDPYTVLGVPRSASDDEVKAAWREAMKLNHPDRVAHMSAALQKFAHAQTIAIQLAYDAITSERRR